MVAGMALRYVRAHRDWLVRPGRATGLRDRRERHQLPVSRSDWRRRKHVDPQIGATDVPLHRWRQEHRRLSAGLGNEPGRVCQRGCPAVAKHNILAATWRVSAALPSVDARRVGGLRGRDRQRCPALMPVASPPSSPRSAGAHGQSRATRRRNSRPTRCGSTTGWTPSDRW